MVVLGLLCYQWLSRRVVCSAKEVCASWQCRAEQGGMGMCALYCPGPGSAEQGWGSSVGRGLAVGAVLDGTVGTCGGERDVVSWGRGRGKEEVPHPSNSPLRAIGTSSCTVRLALPRFCPQCWETCVGQDLYRFVVMDFIFTLLDTGFGELLWR